MKVFCISLILLFSTIACNNIIDLRPTDPAAVPESVVQVVKNKYPDASDLVLKTLVNKAVWEARFTVHADRYTSLVNTKEMFETFRAAPDSSAAFLTELLAATSFRGGTISANSVDADFDTKVHGRHKLKYVFGGNEYRLEWYYTRGTNYKPANASFETLRYKILLTDAKALPKEASDFLNAHPDLTFQWFETWIGLDDQKMYNVRVLFKTAWGKDELGDILLNEKGELKWMSRSFNAPQVYSPESNIDVLPPPVQLVLAQSPELANFSYASPEQHMWRSEYAGVQSYYLYLSYKNGAESCILYFDANGVLLYKRYFTSL